jgi:hypothetical protein
MESNEEAAKLLAEIHPNPFQESLSIDFSMKEIQQVQIKIYNELGQLLSSYNKTFAGEKVLLKTGHLSAGLYEVVVSAEGWNESHKLIKTR